MLDRVNDAKLLLPDFSLILCGYLVCRFTALNRTVWQQVDALVYFFLFPVLLFHSMLKSPLSLSSASSMMAAGLSLGLSGILLSYSLPYLPGVGRWIDRRQHAGAAQVGFRFNSFIALALVDRLGGSQGLLQMAVLIGVCVPMFNFAAVWPMARHSQRSFIRELLRNPLVIATGSGLIANLAGFQIPGWIEPTVVRIGGSSIALGLMAAGAGLQLSQLGQHRLLSTGLLSVRHLISPLVAWFFAQLYGLNPLQTQVLLIFSGMPTAASCYVLASRMGYDGGYVAGLVTLSTLLGMLSLPYALSLL
jgi:malonate transporter